MIQTYRTFRSQLLTGDIVVPIAGGAPVFANALGVIVRPDDLVPDQKSDDLIIYTTTKELRSLPQYLHEIGAEVVAVAEPINRDKIASIVRVRAKEALETGVHDSDLIVSGLTPVIEVEDRRTSAVESTGAALARALHDLEDHGLITVMRMTCPDHHNPEPCPLCP